MKFNYKRFSIYIELKIKNLFKYKHAYKNKCEGDQEKKCPVCSTPWPENILQKNINLEYESVYFPPIMNDDLSKIYGNFYGGYLILPKAKKY